MYGLSSIDEAIESFAPDAPAAVKSLYIKIGDLAGGEDGIRVATLLALPDSYTYTTSVPELETMARVAALPSIRDESNLDFYLRMKYYLKDEESEQLRKAVDATLDSMGAQPTDIRVHDKTIVKEFMLANGDSGTRLQFWENYRDWNGLKISIHKNVTNGGSSRNACVVVDPETGKEYVTKIRDIELDEHYSDPRKSAIFQEATRYYGVPTLDEVTVLPTKQFFTARVEGMILRSINAENIPNFGYSLFTKRLEKEYDKRKARGLRVAERMPQFNVPSPKNNQSREDLTSEERELLERWFPSEIFDDQKTVRLQSYSSIGNGYQSGSSDWTFDVINLNPKKFAAWYKSSSEQQKERADKSIRAVYNMVNDGFLFDLFGPLNFAIRDGEFVLLDAEPVSLSNLPVDTDCVGYSERILNSMFETIGLPTVSYTEIVKRNYGGDKYLKLESSSNARINPQSSMSMPSESWRTNITSAEELAHYRKILDEMVAAKGVLPPRKNLPKELSDKHRELLNMPDNFFAHEKYDWNILRD